jgi:hypothetical protein
MNAKWTCPETTERKQLFLRVPFFLCQQRVPEPASQVPISVVSDICKANVGCGSENPSKLGSSLALHSISDDINSPEIQGKLGPVRQRGSVPSIFRGGTYGDNHKKEQKRF